MQRKLFFLLNLHLFTEKQLFFLLCIITINNMLIGLIYLWRKRYFIELFDVVVLVFCIIEHAYVLFLIEHIYFFSCLIYLHSLLFVVGWVFMRYSPKVVDKLNAEIEEERKKLKAEIEEERKKLKAEIEEERKKLKAEADNNDSPKIEEETK